MNAQEFAELCIRNVQMNPNGFGKVGKNKPGLSFVERAMFRAGMIDDDGVKIERSARSHDKQEAKEDHIASVLLQQSKGMERRYQRKHSRNRALTAS